MPCKSCEHIKDVNEAEGPYVIRTCPQCNRLMRLREPGKHGLGVQVHKGDQLVIPAGWLKKAANPLAGSGHFSKSGLGWFAQLVFGNGLEARRGDFRAAIDELQNEHEAVLRNSPLLAEFDVDDPDQFDAIFEKLSMNQNTPEWWLYVSAGCLSTAKTAIDNDDAALAGWAVGCAERFRSLYVFKEHFEDVVWMGHSAKRLTELSAARASCPIQHRHVGPACLARRAKVGPERAR
jgi:hypothetical protein